MTRLWNDAATFADDLLAGFSDAYSRYVTQVPGGVVRSAPTADGKVAVVLGGGSGHYPAFFGVVGPGFADGAVVGNVFTSPSTADAVSVGRNAAGDAGVLFLTGNYAGDVMNFRRAADQLTADGIPARYLAITDDVASAAPSEAATRRGIAGGFAVFKAASAAAEEGLPLADVERAAAKANARTRTLGVAFGGCTMPGATSPLFTVPDGHMSVGMGIHGEPGIRDAPMPSAAELARVLVDGVLADAPAGADGGRVAVILNGLGATKYEELFVVWRSVRALLDEAGLTPIDHEIGELVTSLDMAGCSLSLTWLDEELERWWTAPADTPAFRKGTASPAQADGVRRQVREPLAAATTTPHWADDDARRCAATIVTCLASVAESMAEAEQRLGDMDAVAGDGDHGRGMVKGSSAAHAAAAAAVAEGAGAGTVLRSAGTAWAAKAGGTSGALWGVALEAIGRRFGDDGSPSTATIATALDDGLRAISEMGKAELGDKTMLDALAPFVDVLRPALASGESLAAAWAEAAAAATKAAHDTASLRPKVGRARPLADRSVGAPDPGATSLAICLTAIGDVLGSAADRREDQ